MLPVLLQCWSQTAAWLGSKGLPPVLRCRALGVHKHRGYDTPKTSWMRFCTLHVYSVGWSGGSKCAWQDPTGCTCNSPRLGEGMRCGPGPASRGMWEGVRAPGTGAHPAGAVPGGVWEGVRVHASPSA